MQMFSNISPYLCCNLKEFHDETNHLNQVTFPKLKQYFQKLNVNFDATHVKWNETDNFVQEGLLLRLLLTCIQNSRPFFLCLLGQQYGDYLKEEKSINVQKRNLKFRIKKEMKFLENEVSVSATRPINWLEKNFVIAQRTGFSNIINKTSQNNSLLELQIKMALNSHFSNHQFFRFYYRQPEYLDEKYFHLSREKRKLELTKHEAEDEYSSNRIAELKAKISKRGLTVKYYKSLEELDRLVFDDLTEMIKGLLNDKDFLDLNRSQLQTECFVANKLNKFIFTETLSHIENELLKFINTSERANIKYGLNENQNSADMADGISNENANEDFMEILKLRHINLANSVMTTAKQSIEQRKPSIFLISAPTGYGKTTFISHMYRQINCKREQLCLFYFLRPDFSLFSVFIDVVKKVRLTYLSVDCTASIDSEFHDRKSIIEEFHSSLKYGPVVIFIDGLCAIEPKNYLPIDIWLPKRLEKNCKFVFTLNSSSKLYDEFVSTRKKQYVHKELITFKYEADYKQFFSKFLITDYEAKFDNSDSKLIVQKHDPHNSLFNKFLRTLPELKIARHFTSPLYCQIIAQEIFSFDKDLYDNHPFKYIDDNSRRDDANDDFYSSSDDDAINTTYLESSSLSVKKQKVLNMFDIYIDDVYTLNELFQYFIKRQLFKYSWNFDASVPVSIENPGWIGEILCLICLSANGISKHSLMNILFSSRGYINEYEVMEYDWQMFKMLFNCFISCGLDGLMCFSHDSFKDAVQSLLMDGFSIVTSVNYNSIMPRQNISNKEREIHLSIINDILVSRLDKNVFNICSKVFNPINYDDPKLRCFETICDLIHHLYMIYDMNNMCKFILNFKVLQVVFDTRMKNVNLWYKFIEYVEAVIPDEALQIILTNNLTMGMAFEIYLGEQVYTLNNADILSKTEKTKPVSNNVLEFHLKFRDVFNQELAVTGQSEQDLEISRYISSMIYAVDYEHSSLVDQFLSFTFTSETESDSISLLLLSRLLILTNMMEHLDKKDFMKKEVINLYQLINDFVIKNYPLNDNEKYFYAKILEQMALYYTRNSNFDESLKIYLKCIDLLEDLYTGFDVNNLNLKLKTRINYLRLSNRISLHYSSVSLIHLKMDCYDEAEFVLRKSFDYNRNNIKDEINKNYLNYLYNSTEVIILENKKPFKKINRKLETRLDMDDGLYYNAKCQLNLNKAFFETFKLNFAAANKYFQSALGISIKWYGLDHSNTCKIYHFYGCFHSMPNRPFFSTRKAELYLRKAFYICEKYKILMAKRNDESSVINNSEASLVNDYENVKYCLWYRKEQKKNISHEHLDDDEKNSISTILYDLGCLLSNYESIILRKEGIECLRRSLDIKSLIFGPNHPECELIKEFLTFVEIQNNIVPSENGQIDDQRNKMYKRAKTANVLTARSKILHNLSALKKETNLNEAKTDNSMIDWLNKNGVQNLKSKTIEDFLVDGYQLSEYLSSKEDTLSETKSRTQLTKIPSSYSLSGFRKTVASLSDVSFATSHQRKCYCPTKSSIDIHNAYSIHGPHSRIKDLVARVDPKLAILKPIYYKSTWYDLPAGSLKKRFKEYRKLCPNIYNDQNKR